MSKDEFAIEVSGDKRTTRSAKIEQEEDIPQLGKRGNNSGTGTREDSEISVRQDSKRSKIN